MDFIRNISEQLNNWKLSKQRKPLVLRGARQVGKTTLIKQFAQSYKNSIVLNLEKETDITFFKETDDVKTIIEALFLIYDITINEIGETLLFIDEIQESPKAIQLLRYFYEEIPELHVIAAGSLLEFAMHKVKSFPVGRIQYLYMHPLNFPEYLNAIGHKQALEHFNIVPVKQVAHSTLLKLFNRYAIIGGMPEVIKTYIKDETVTELSKIYESIWKTYQEDVEKYASNETERKVTKHIISTAHLYLDQRVKFQNFGNSNYRSREVGEALRNLDAAKVIRLIYPTTSFDFPVIPDIKKSPRLQFLDTGLLNYTLGVQAEMLTLKDLSSFYKGALIPHLITQELISLNSLNDKIPNFWVREKKQSSAEVDLVYRYKNMIIPIEVKSGSTGSLKSLHLFIENADHPYAVRVFAGEFKIEEHKTQSGKNYFLMNLPYYLGAKIPDYIEYFVEKFPLK
jgi:predicted AAA+ superfamily ATPase